MENENQTEMQTTGAEDTYSAAEGAIIRPNYASRKAEKTERQGKQQRSKKWREKMYWGIPLLVILGITIWLFTLPRKYVSPVVKGKNHIHATLAITINGTPVTIPGGIGLGPGGGAVHIPGAQQVIHTHVDNDQLHIEATTGGPLHEKDTEVSTFFRIWGKEFNATTILDKTTLDGGTLQFKVNGTENMDFQNYQMRDGDKLEIVYTSKEVSATAATSSTQ